MTGRGKYNKKISHKISKAKTSLSLTQECMKPYHLIDISKLTSLTELSIYDCVNLNGKLDFLRGLTNLQKLELSFCEITDDDLINLASLKNLTHLDLTQNPISGIGFSGLLLTALEDLTIMRSSVDFVGITSICNTCPNLKKIIYYDTCYKFDKDCLLKLCTSLKHLNQITLCDVNIFDYTALSTCSTLKTFSTCYTESESPCNYIGFKNIRPKHNKKYSQTIFPFLPKLESLHLYRELSEIVMPDIHLYSSLKDLSVSSLKHDLIGPNITKLTNLEKLNVHCYLQNNDLNFLLNMTQLEELDLRYNHNLDNNMLQYTTNLSNLKLLNLVGTKNILSDLEKYKHYYSSGCEFCCRRGGR